MEHQLYMQEAIIEAKKAAAANEVPIGAVLVVKDKIVARAHNQVIAQSNPCAHAEILALQSYCRDIENHRTRQATLYVTVEPCLMCVGALLHSRIESLVYGASEPKTGAVESLYTAATDFRQNHQVRVTSGVMADTCAQIMKSFFESRRK